MITERMRFASPPNSFNPLVSPHSHRRRARRPLSPALAARDIRTAPLDRDCSAAVQLLAAALRPLRAFLWGAEPAETVPHIAARLHDETAVVARDAWSLASLVIGRSIGAAIVSPAALDAARTALQASALSIPALGGIPEVRRDVRPAQGKNTAAGTGLDDAGTLLHEVALEEFDAALFLGTDRDGTELLAWHPVATESAFVDLLEPLFEMADYLANLDPLLAIEYGATAWWFGRWSAREFMRTESSFATGVRAREWMLADRRTMATRAPFLQAFIAEPLASWVPRKQRALAVALLASQPSLFVVRARSGAQALLENLADMTTVSIHEHSPSTGYGAGDIGAGRLLHLDKDRVVRSPGMMFFTPPSGTDDFVTRIRPALRSARAAMSHPAIAVEAVVSAVFGEHVPRSSPVNASARDARELLRELNELLTNEGRVHEIPAHEAPPEMQATLAAGPGRQVMGYDIDEPLAQYAAALGARARIPGGVSSATTPSRKKRRRR